MEFSCFLVILFQAFDSDVLALSSHQTPTMHLTQALLSMVWNPRRVITPSISQTQAKPTSLQKSRFSNIHHMPCLPTSAHYPSASLRGYTLQRVLYTAIFASASWLGRGLFHGIVRDLLSWSSAKREKKKNDEVIMWQTQKFLGVTATFKCLGIQFCQRVNGYYSSISRRLTSSFVTDSSRVNVWS
ncbi:hypothetical protein KCU59_g151, partial [Aureobasidium melanogenum]